jgi:hypothetical protein
MNIRAYRWSRSDVGKRTAVQLLAASAVAVMVFGASVANAQSDDRPTANGSTLESVSPPSSGDWERVDGTPADAADDSSNNQVLEVPQAIDPNDAAAAQADAGGDPSAANPSDSQQQADGSGDGDSEDAPDEIGSINDYQSQRDDVGPAAVLIPPMAGRPFGMSPPVGFNPPMPIMRPPYVPPAGLLPGGVLPPRPVMIRPGVTGYIPPSSPMFMAPRPMGSIPGGWWNRVRR